MPRPGGGRRGGGGTRAAERVVTERVAAVAATPPLSAAEAAMRGKLVVHEGRERAATGDKGGTSDPYVKLTLGGASTRRGGEEDAHLLGRDLRLPRHAGRMSGRTHAHSVTSWPVLQRYLGEASVTLGLTKLGYLRRLRCRCGGRGDGLSVYLGGRCRSRSAKRGRRPPSAPPPSRSGRARGGGGGAPLRPRKRRCAASSS